METYTIPGTKGLTVYFQGKSYTLLEDIFWEDYGNPIPGSVFRKYHLDYTPDDMEYYGWPISAEAQCQPSGATEQDCDNFTWTAYFSFTVEEYDQCQEPGDFLKFLDGICELEND